MFAFISYAQACKGFFLIINIFVSNALKTCLSTIKVFEHD